MKNHGEVKTRLRGGLGNQLFQISAGVCLAKACNIPLKINTKDLDASLEKNRGNFLHSLELGNILNLSNLEYSFVKENFVSNRIYHRFGKKFQTNYISSSIDLLDKIASHSFETYRLRGFFQDLRIVEKSLNASPRVTLQTLRSEVVEITQLVSLKNTITLHIRLGDFVSSNFDILSSDYFLSAIDEFATHFDDRDFEVVVFSDDIQGARGMLHDRDGIIFPELDWILTPAELLYVLSNAKNLVISKSTLAWWAGYIGYFNGNRIWSPWTNRFEIG